MYVKYKQNTQNLYEQEDHQWKLIFHAATSGE